METRTQDLSPARRALVDRMQEVAFGRIRYLQVREGEPVFDAASRVERMVKFGAQKDGPSGASSKEYVLKAKMVEFLDCLDAIGTGKIIQIEIKGGLPFSMIIEEQPA